jgi:hypothetical protein
LDRVARGVAGRFVAISAEEFVKKDWSCSCESFHSRTCESAGRDRSVTIVVQWRSKIQPLDASLYQVWKQQMRKGRKLPRPRLFLVKHQVNNVGQVRISFSVVFF